MSSTFPIRGSQALAVFASIAAHAAMTVAAAHYGNGKAAIDATPTEFQVDVEPPVVAPPEETEPALPDPDPVVRSPHLEHRVAGAAHAAAAAPRVLVAEAAPRATFAIVLGTSDAVTGGRSSAVGDGDGAGSGLTQGSGGPSPDPPSDVDAIVPDSAVSQHARMMSPFKPEYPPAALAHGIEVSVTLEIVVDREGRVTDARVVRGAGYGFEESALRSLRSARLSPARREGHPVRVRMPWVIDFRIE